jgi:protein-glutamine gamma-glutamyltransferase
MFRNSTQQKTNEPHGSLAISTTSMAFGTNRALRYFLFVTVSLSIAAATIENGLHPLVLLVLPVVYLALCRRDYGEPFLWSETMGSVLFFLYVPAFCLLAFLFRAAVSLPFFIVYFTFGILMVRVLSPLTDRNIWQVIFLSLGLIFVNCILTNDMLFGLILPFYLFSLMSTLLFFHLARYRALSGCTTEPAGSLTSGKTWSSGLAKYAFVILCFTILGFIFLPRPFITLPGLSTAMAGGGVFGDLSQQIRYGGLGGMAGSQRIAFIVSVKAGKLPSFPYWRGRVLDRTDGHTWYANSQSTPRTKLVKAGGAKIVKYEIVPYALQSRIVYNYGFPIWALGKGRQALYITSNAEIVVDSPFLVSDTYNVTAAEAPVPAYLKPDNINVRQDGVTPKIANLAKKWTSKYSSIRDKAEALVARLRGGYKYVLQNPAPPASGNPIEYFLFKSRTGDCEYFAGALCLMLRSLHIPARVVDGFAGMESTDLPNQFLVRFSRAHAWVEAVLDGSTWTTLDATPALLSSPGNELWRLLADTYDKLDYNWTKYVIYFDRSDQATLLANISRLFKGETSIRVSFGSKRGSYVAISIIASILLSLLSFAIYGLYKKPRGFPAIYTSTMKNLVKKGLLSEVRPWHELNSSEIITHAPELKQSLTGFMDLYLRARFGGDSTVSGKKLEDAGRELLENARPQHTGSRH